MSKIAIRVDTNKTIATGHVMRCMAVAAQLIKMGADVYVISADEGVCPFVGKTDERIYSHIMNTDWSDMEAELPALIAGFAYGPVAGVMVEFIKIVLKVLFKGTSTAFVGELANFFVGCSFVLPTTVIYLAKKSKVNAIISCAVGTLVITIVGSSFNAFYLLPTFAKMFGMDIDTIIAMGTAVNSHVTSLSDFIFLIVAPVNILKGVMVSVVTLLIYKPLSPILKGKH